MTRAGRLLVLLLLVAHLLATDRLVHCFLDAFAPAPPALAAASSCGCLGCTPGHHAASCCCAKRERAPASESFSFVVDAACRGGSTAARALDGEPLAAPSAPLVPLGLLPRAVVVPPRDEVAFSAFVSPLSKVPI